MGNEYFVGNSIKSLYKFDINIHQISETSSGGQRSRMIIYFNSLGNKLTFNYLSQVSLESNLLNSSEGSFTG